MIDFNVLKYGLDILRGAVIQDHFSHLDVCCKDAPESIVASNFSMQVGKPVCFRHPEGRFKYWWTNGVRHNPNGPTIELAMSGGDFSTRYTDENGFPHRLDGPCTVDQRNSTYIEQWMIHPGTMHRVGGPAFTEIKEHNPTVMTWAEFVKNSTYFIGDRYMFEDGQEVRFHDSCTQTWVQHGRPKNGKNGYTFTKDEGICVVVEITPALIPKVTRITGLREYRWLDEEGNISRTDGPAVVRLRNVVEREVCGAKDKIKWSESGWSWCYKGNMIDSYEIGQWQGKHKIKMLDRPPIAESAFVNPDDEFCFMTDFLSEYEPRSPF